MSYCRFSSDNWKCDVYCYGASGGTFVTQGAGYNVPQYVIDEVELEIVDEAKLKGGSDATV